ncbi:TrpB-like pyridoxal phosphate-dependent enzyme [Pyrobaculum arsenaticum]|uniref:Tryptophan synthase beta chain n=1 Tax=Pyrobaculum arsenaticum (strain DSM 13514 / JCM 11321 / PZ6) TaxID=340102 RepID=TRPB_PYRAR|nr:TrpB-like pyridoxal phosphate-dependent enzyme [Pyrobaculum arsenaticum]A4WKQ9.1 RecName: Full=Tryptophan synthase beta chain [Pyrobaculum arsenaticum DSM 13514]ABP50976.1 tryptophan synthase, beta chain [Pyrobaculum arsenaticum DSM 13514]
MVDRWYNIAADLPAVLAPPKDPDEGESRIGLLTRILPSALIDQEFSAERWITVPEEVRDAYRRVGRPTPLLRAEGLERALGTGVRIYYKYEGVLPVGSHKLNTALAQAYYAKADGAVEVATETGAGQWGMAVSLAAALFGLKAVVFMTRSSYNSKRQRLTFMRTYGATVYPSPSEVTEAGRRHYRPDHPGSLGIAISEAVEYVLSGEKRHYLPGSVLEFVLMHQTVIGLEAVRQLPEEPDAAVACVGGGSNFAGFTYPMIGMKLRGEGFDKTRFVAVEAEAAPKLTKGEYKYDFPDAVGILPMIKMYTLGHDYVPPPVHAAGLRYHGAAPSLSLLRKLGIVEPLSYPQEEVMKAAVLFARTEGIVPAPESAHAIRAVLDLAKKLPRGSVIAFNLSGHGLLDSDAYEKFL